MVSQLVGALPLPVVFLQLSLPSYSAFVHVQSILRLRHLKWERSDRTVAIDGKETEQVRKDFDDPFMIRVRSRQSSNVGEDVRTDNSCEGIPFSRANRRPPDIKMENC